MTAPGPVPNLAPQGSVNGASGAGRALGALGPGEGFAPLLSALGREAQAAHGCAPPTHVTDCEQENGPALGGYANEEEAGIRGRKPAGGAESAAEAGVLVAIPVLVPAAACGETQPQVDAAKQAAALPGTPMASSVSGPPATQEAVTSQEESGTSQGEPDIAAAVATEVSRVGRTGARPHVEAEPLFAADGVQGESKTAAAVATQESAESGPGRAQPSGRATVQGQPTAGFPGGAFGGRRDANEARSATESGPRKLAAGSPPSGDAGGSAPQRGIGQAAEAERATVPQSESSLPPQDVIVSQRALGTSSVPHLTAPTQPAEPVTPMPPLSSSEAVGGPPTSPASPAGREGKGGEERREESNAERERGNESRPLAETRPVEASPPAPAREQAEAPLRHAAEASRSDAKAASAGRAHLEREHAHTAPPPKQIAVKVDAEALGRTEVRVSVRGAHVATVMQTSSWEAKQLLESRPDLLRDGLGAEGLLLNQMSVDVHAQRHNHPWGGQAWALAPSEAGRTGRSGPTPSVGEQGAWWHKGVIDLLA